MSTQQLAAMYDHAHGLAERGQYADALAALNDYLVHRPEDGRAINDAATILFCQGRGPEAIRLYEKASRLCSGEELGQVLWNLCEAYLQEGRAAQAIGLFDTIEEMGLMNVDMLHRAADALLEKRFLGPAVELLLQSLRINPEQEVLKSMIEVIGHHRARTAIVSCDKHALAQSLAEGLKPRLPLTVIETRTDQAVQLAAETDIAVFFGCGQALIDASSQMSSMRLLAVLNEQDMRQSQIEAVNWHGVQTVVLCGGQAAAKSFAERIGSLPEELEVLTAEPIANPERAAFRARRRGKRIAAVGPWDARRNPMFALMCFQKLHYLDPDTRLHLGGEFADAATRDYVEHLIETLELDNVVFLDGPIGNMQKWLRDKHYLLSTAIDGAGFETVWQAMACGLRPVVHTFAGLDERLDAAYIFTLAEDFCEHVLSRPYEPAACRSYVERAYAQRGLEPLVLDAIFRFEQDLSTDRSPLTALPPVQTTAPLQPSFCATEPMPSQAVDQAASEALTAMQAFSQEIPADNGQKIDQGQMTQQQDGLDTAAADSGSNGGCGLSVEELTEARRGITRQRRRTPVHVS